MQPREAQSTTARTNVRFVDEMILIVKSPHRYVLVVILARFYKKSFVNRRLSELSAGVEPNEFVVKGIYILFFHVAITHVDRS